MQSDPSEVSQNTTVNLSSPASPNNSSQHGQHHPSEHGSDHLFGSLADGQSHHAFAAGYTSDDVSSQGDEGPFRLRRLSSRSSGKSSSPVDRIREHENAHTSSPRMDGHLGFVVVPSRSKRNPDRSIENFPNGKFGVIGLYRLDTNFSQRS